MDERTKRWHFWIAIVIGLATALLVPGPFASAFGMAIGWIYAAFAFQPTMKRAIAMSVMTAIWIFGVTYLFEVRRDLAGFAVTLVCVAICFAIYWPFRRELRESR